VRRRLFVSASLLAAAAAGLWWRARPPGGRAGAASDGRFAARAAALAFDTTVSVCALHPDPARAQRAAERALREITRLDALLTVQRPGSQVARLNESGRLERPHPHLVRVLEFAQALAGASAGSFDPTVQPLWHLHLACQRRGRRPDRDELARACARIDWRALDVSARRAGLPPGMAITLNGLAQGYAADVALDALAQEGVHDALIDAGEFGAQGCRPSGGPWRVGIQHPRNPAALVGVVPMDGRFLATSGDYATAFTPDFASNHIFDPRTGHSPSGVSSVAVAAASGLLADGLTKPMMVLERAAAQRLLRRFPGAGAVWIDKSGRIDAVQGLTVEAATLTPAPHPAVRSG
jgi:thiamine biosynthesis lipoprotein